MVPSVAARLRSLLEEDPSRSCCSLLLTGHSAGGAVATLLYAHMLCEELQSELNVLTGCKLFTITPTEPLLPHFPVSQTLSLPVTEIFSHTCRLQENPLHHLRHTSNISPPTPKTLRTPPQEITFPLLHQRR